MSNIKCAVSERVNDNVKQHTGTKKTISDMKSETTATTIEARPGIHQKKKEKKRKKK
jgi:hypothetical protein